jgi:drug/metabolite transporter (DMT)-like permease
MSNAVADQRPTAPARTRYPSPAHVALVFALVYVFWGSTYLAIRIAVVHIPPTMICAIRFLIAGPPILAWCLFTRRTIMLEAKQLLRLAVIGVLLLTGGNMVVAWSEQYVPSGISALIVAAVPLWVMVLERCMTRGEHLSARGLAGLAMGIAGIGLLMWPKLHAGNLAGQRELLGAGTLILAAGSWALGSILSRRWQSHTDALVATGWEITFAGLSNLLLTFITGEYARTQWATSGLLSIAYLVVFGSWVGFTAYIWLLNHVPTAKVATYAYVNPVVAVSLGWLVLHEVVDRYVFAGTVIVVAAVALVTTARVRRGGGVEVTSDRKLPTYEGAD